MYNAKKFSICVVSVFLCLALGAGLLVGCDKGASSPEASSAGTSSEGTPAGEPVDNDTSYAFGMLMATQFIQMGLEVEQKAYIDGFNAVNEAKETRFTREEALEKVAALSTRMQAKEEEAMWLEGEKNREAGDAYLAENKARSGVTVTASGLQYEVITQGSGQKPGATDMVRVHYEGTLIDGTAFDSSYTRGEPTEFPLNQVIPGWTEGLQLMNVGSTYRFVIPSNLAYGEQGSGPIPPSSTLIFKVELLEIVTPSSSGN